MADHAGGEHSAYIRRRIESELPEIMDGFLVQSKKGGVAHMKLIVHLLSTPLSLPAAEPAQEGVLQFLLEQIEEEDGQDDVMNRTARDRSRYT